MSSIIELRQTGYICVIGLIRKKMNVFDLTEMIDNLFICILVWHIVISSSPVSVL